MPPAPLQGKELAARTFAWERLRNLCTGLIELLWQPSAAVVLLVAIRHYDAGPTIKSLITASGSIGFLFTPLSLGLLARGRLTLTQNMALLAGVAGLLLLATPWLPGLTPFVAMTVLAQIILVQQLPLQTALYAGNFPAGQRGHRIATLMLVSGSVSIVANYVVGDLLDADILFFRPFLLVCGLCCLLSAACLLKIPGATLAHSSSGHPWRHLALAWKDRLFGWMLSAWMLMGFGNLMTLPLRTEYMANPAYGINASNQTILLVTGAVPLVARLLASRLLGRLFDRWNFIALRSMLNLLFLASLGIFFNTHNLWLLSLGMVLQGAAMAGGHITWSLWVTKLAPPENTSAYMSVHMVTTGIRGTLAPFLGFYLLSVFTPGQVGGIGCALMGLSTLMLFPSHRHFRLRGQELDDGEAMRPAPRAEDTV